MAAAASSTATTQPRVTLMTALPLVWGEGDAADVIVGRSRRSDVLQRIEAEFTVRAIDTLSAVTLGNDVAILAQPRRLAPVELVAFDTWVRRGGRAMIFADPELVWPSRYALGDNRRAPPVELLDPLFAHWGLTLGDTDRLVRTVAIDGRSVTIAMAGAWTGPATCTPVVAQVFDCAIGRGRVVLVGDADLLDARLDMAVTNENAAWIVARLKTLSGLPRKPRPRR